jgi:hypothetical protein
MDRRTKHVGVLLCLAAMAGFVSWPVYRYFTVNAASARLQRQTKALVDKNPQLQPAWTIALQDDVLTSTEAKVIVEAAGEKVEVEE